MAKSRDSLELIGPAVETRNKAKSSTGKKYANFENSGNFYIPVNPTTIISKSSAKPTNPSLPTSPGPISSKNINPSHNPRETFSVSGVSVDGSQQSFADNPDESTLKTSRFLAWKPYSPFAPSEGRARIIWNLK